jgi:thiol-disulfide isomerase/thioredoxin
MKALLLLAILFSSFLQAKELNDFKLPIYPKGEFSYTSASKEKKKVVINFWASWCTSCAQEVPLLENLQKQNLDVIFLAINAGDSKRKIKKFLKKYGFTWKVLMDKNKTFSKGLGVVSLPKTMVIDSKGKIIYEDSVPPQSL